MTEVADTLALIRDRVDGDLIVDADTGYGNALNVVRTVREFERAGATAIQLEDQDFPKRCGHLDGKALIAADEMCGKIRAAVDARRSRETLIIARTDAVAVEGFDRADRARDADTARPAPTCCSSRRPRPAATSSASSTELGRSLPLMANMVEGGKTPPLSAAELEAIGFSLVIFPGGIVRALGQMSRDYYGSLASHGTTEPFRSRMLDFDGLNELIGTPELVKLGKRYEP